MNTLILENITETVNTLLTP